MKGDLTKAVKGKVKPIKKLQSNINVTNKYLVVATMFITLKILYMSPYLVMHVSLDF